MRVNNTSSQSFQAHIPKEVYNRLFTEARKRGTQISFDYLEKTDKFLKWGEDTSALTIIENKNKDGIKTYALGLINSYTAPFKQIMLSKKESLLDSFMALKERDILNAEGSLNRF